MESIRYIVSECSHGKCLIATEHIPASTVIEVFGGDIVRYPPGSTDPTPPEVPDDEVCYFLIVNDETVIIPRTNARYINHGCDPNCDINDRLEVVTIRDVDAGEELTFSYNDVGSKPATNAWDPRWTFTCTCGSPICQGVIDKYVYRDGDR
jgi:hypothetical protein